MLTKDFIESTIFDNHNPFHIKFNLHMKYDGYYVNNTLLKKSNFFLTLILFWKVWIDQFVALQFTYLFFVYVWNISSISKKVNLLSGESDCCFTQVLCEAYLGWFVDIPWELDKFFAALFKHKTWYLCIFKVDDNTSKGTAKHSKRQSVNILLSKISKTKCFVIRDIIQLTLNSCLYLHW